MNSCKEWMCNAVKPAALTPDAPLSTEGSILKEIRVEIESGLYNTTGKLFNLSNP